MPKFGVEYFAMSYYPKNAAKNKDIKVSMPDLDFLLGIEITVQKMRNKFSLVFENMNLGEGVAILTDSAFYTDGSVTNGGRTGNKTSRVIHYLGILYSRTYKPSKESRFSCFWGAGTGIGINKSETYYREVQNAGYSSLYAGGENIVSIQRWAKPTGNGIFLHLWSGLSYINKKGKEAIIFEIFWRQGLRKMVEYTVDYSYSSPLRPSYGRSVTGYRFNNRGTTFGTTLGFPISLSKHQRRKKK